MSPTRRELLKLGLAVGAGALFPRSVLGRPVAAAPSRTSSLQDALITKPIPSTGERIPVIGLGSAGSFNLSPQNRDYEAGREVVRLFHELGGTVIDTSPSYQRSETFLGEVVTGFGIQEDLFAATKVNVGSDGKEAAFRQMEESSGKWGKEVIDLMQVWNLGDSIRNLTDRYLDDHMEAVTEWKERGRARYIGITTSRDPQYSDVLDALERYTVDFVQLDYSIGDRIPEQHLLPLAQEKGVAVLANRPFTSGGLFGRVRDKPLPEWAAGYQIESWAQYFLKFIVSHPAVTATIPATGDPEHLVDNMGACRGRLPDEPTRLRMAAYFEAL